MKMRAPSIPLITVDPYFSVWSPDEKLNVTRTVHWTGKNNSIIGTVDIDGHEYSFLGYHRNLHKLEQVSLDIDDACAKATSDTYTPATAEDTKVVYNVDAAK